MPCYYPITGYRSTDPNENGKYPIKFQRKGASEHDAIKLPCGRCIGCRLDKSVDWALRCMHESKLHDDSCFITLTFDDENLPRNKSISPRDFQLFIKKLRKKYAPKKIRYFACGEYGTPQNPIDELSSKLGRPHYHALLFGHEFKDAIAFQQTDYGTVFYSEELESIWGKGFCTIAPVTFETAAYTARYSCKKIGGDMADDHYKYTELETGEIYDLHPEFSLSSRAPSIGDNWAQKYETDLQKGYITHNGKRYKLPKRYDKLMLDQDNLVYHQTREKRLQDIDSLDLEKGMERLRVKEKVKNLKAKNLHRKL